MNKAKIESSIRTAVKAIAGILIGFFATKLGIGEDVINQGADYLIMLALAVVEVVYWIKSINAPEKEIPEEMRQDLKSGKTSPQALRAEYLHAA